MKIEYEYEYEYEYDWVRLVADSCYT